jgi:hypothetical protein
MTTQPVPIRSTEDLVAELVDLREKAEGIAERQAAIRAELAKLPVGSHETPAGAFDVRAPSRKFDSGRAYDSLPKDAQALCVGVVPALVKAQIPPAALDAFMVGGTGPNTVVLK